MTLLEKSNLPLASSLFIKTSPKAVIGVRMPPLSRAMRGRAALAASGEFLSESGGNMRDNAASEIITIDNVKFQVSRTRADNLLAVKR